MSRSCCILLALLLLVPGPVSWADDVVVQLAQGDAFVIQDSIPNDRFRFEESGHIFKGSVRFLHEFGIGNVFGGSLAGNLTLNPSVATNNTGFGQAALQGITTANSNTAFGRSALGSDTSGNGNSAFGLNALGANDTGFSNAAFGNGALSANTSAFGNSAFGTSALAANTNAGSNSAFGFNSMVLNTVGAANSAFGHSSLGGNLSGSSNSAFGQLALLGNESGSLNSAFGISALSQGTGGLANTALGAFALSSMNSGNSNIGIGNGAGSSLDDGSNNIYLGNPGAATESGTIRIGEELTHTATFIQGISGNVVTGSNVLVSASGELGVTVSSIRFKDDVRDMDDASDALMALRPVVFRYREEYVGSEETTHFGLIAEEVATVAPGLVELDDQGRPFSVRYQFLAPMLLNEVQEQQRTIDEQQAMIATLVERVEQLEARSEMQPKGDAR